MCKLRPTMALVLVALLFTLTACAKKSDPAPTTTTTVKIDEVRKQAAAAFDGTTSSAQRRSAADEAMRLLLAFLGQPDSASVADKDWSTPPRAGVGPMVRHFDLGGGVHLYALALPGNTLVETRERVAVQIRKSGSDPRATELTLLPDSKLQAARAHKDGARQMVTLALSLSTGGGYVAHFAAAGEGKFEAAASAFAGLGGKYGDITLATRDPFLLVNREGAGEWSPAFDQKQPLRLLVGPELTLDWKQKFVVVDDSKFDAFALFKIALNPYGCKGPDDCPEALLEQAKKSPKDAAKAAWDLATAKMTALLQNDKTWTDDFAGKLPDGARSLREQGRELSVRLIAVPAPEGVTPRAYTAVQFRTGGGIAMARTLTLPGMVDAYKVMSHEGLPALFLLVDQAKEPKANLRTRGLHLLRLNAGNDWVPAEKWIGSIPNAPHWNLTAVTPNTASIEWEASKSPSLTVTMGSGAEPGVSVCKFPTDCHKLSWVGGKLHSIDVLYAQLTESAQALPEDQLVWRAGQVAQFLSAIDPATVTTGQLTGFLDPNRVLGIQVFDAGSGTRLVTMPANPTGLRTAVIYARDAALVIQTHDGFVTRWEGARVIQGGSQQRLLILGRSDKAAVLITYQWDGKNWVAVDPLPEKVDQMLMESVRVVNNPGQTRPVQGLMVLGGTRLTASFKGEGLQFCENQVACLTYGYNNGWQLQQ